MSRILKFLVIFMILLPGCSKKNPKEDFENAVIGYKSGNNNSKQNIEDTFIKMISNNITWYKNSQVCGELLFSRSAAGIKIIFPDHITIPLKDKKQIELCDINRDYVILSDRSKIYIYHRDKENSRLIKTVINEKNINNMILHREKIIIFMDKKLRYYDIPGKRGGVYSEFLFSVPYEKYYEVKLLKFKNILGVITGVGGTYYLYMVDLKNNSILLNKLPVSSREIMISDGMLFYIGGSTGNWNVTRHIISENSKKIILKFKDILDFKITEHGFILYSASGLELYNLNGQKVRIPFKYKLTGKSRNTLFFKYNKYIYTVDFLNMVGNIKSLRDKLPEMFIKIE